MTTAIRIRGTRFPFPRLLCRRRGHIWKVIHAAMIDGRVSQPSVIPPEWREYVAAGGLVLMEDTVCDRCGEWRWRYTPLEPCQ